jgi:hypothetical protein
MRLMAYTPDAGIPPGLDGQRAREILGAVVKMALSDYRTGAEPHASKAAQWLDELVGHPRWRDVDPRQFQRQFQRARPR